MRTLVVYATETGCAEALAYSTYLQLRRRSATVCVRTAAGLRPSMLTEYDRLVFVVSTAAYGEFPHTLQALAEALRAHSHAFAAAYTVFGLGDSRYPLFNYAARKLVALLENAGAQCFYRVAYGDDQHPLGHLGEYIAWISGLAELWPLPEAGQQPPTCFRLTVERIGGECNEVKIPIECLEGRIVSNDLLTSEDHFRPVRSVVIRFDGRYDPGDVCCLYPTGDVGEVELALRTLGHDPSDTVVIRSVSGDALEFNRDLELTRGGTYYLKSRTRGKLPFEGRPIKLRTLFAEFLSLNNVCTQWQMEVIAPFAAMDIHRDKLVEMASFTVEGCAQYNRYCKDERRSLLEVLCDFNSVRLPLEVLINIATPYYPRMYSIASIPATIGIARHSASPYDGTPGALSYAAFKRFVAERRRGTGLMELCVAQVTHNTPYNRQVQGQASDFFARAAPGQVVRLEIARSTTARAVLDISVPVLFICTGTGLAAVKPLLEARIEKLAAVWRTQLRRPAVRDLALVGFRRPRQDHLYLADPRLLGLWCDVRVVYSRQAGRKVYVQDALGEFAARVVHILLHGLVVVAGRSHPMPKQVLQRLRDLLVEHARFGARAADRFVECALAGGKILLDTWG